ncbi:hypothetical protein VPH35_106812 [Triticum aestivum]
MDRLSERPLRQGDNGHHEGHRPLLHAVQTVEAGLSKTLRFCLDGLLSEQGNYARALGVVEMELAFLYDFFYTRFDAKFTEYQTLFVATVIPTVIVWNCISGAFSRHYHHSDLEQRVQGTDVIHWVTIVLLAIWFIVFLTEHFMSPSRWAVMERLHDATADETTKMIGMKINVSREKMSSASGHWESKLGQYPLLLNFDYHPWNALSILSLGLVEATREGQKAGEKIKLREQVIVRVLSGFKESNGVLEDGQAALARNQLGSQFSWACTLPTHIHTILVWHIGTTMSMHGDEDPLRLRGNRLVAKSLSDYCAYLVAFVPDMLPGHGYHTQRIFDAVVMEARESLAGCETVSSRCEKLMMMVLPGSNSTVLEMGARLGKELITGVVPEARRCKVLADFWAEFILFLAPSRNAEIHAEMLANGGGFMTHLWVLLTHAGVLDRPSATEPAHGSNV